MSNLKQSLIKALTEKFTFCTEHRAIERVIPGLREHVWALPQDFESFLLDALEKVRKEGYQKGWKDGVKHGMATVRSNTHE